MTPTLESIPDTADRLGLSRGTIYRLLDEGELEAVKVGRARRVLVASTLAYVERLRATTAEAS